MDINPFPRNRPRRLQVGGLGAGSGGQLQGDASEQQVADEAGADFHPPRVTYFTVLKRCTPETQSVKVASKVPRDRTCDGSMTGK